MSLIGTDPEYLVYSPSMSSYVPSIGLLGGDKVTPKAVQGGAILEDNVTAEINIEPVDLNDVNGFINGITGVRTQLDSVLAEHGLETRVQSAASYPAGMLEHPQAMESGCDPDVNVYTLRPNIYPDVSESNVRFAGGHIHFGDDNIFQNPGTRERFIKYCDYYVGGPLSLLDTDTRRSKTYGAAGNFRYKPYGVEYRTPSNVWLQSPETITFVVQQMRRAKRALETEERTSMRYAEGIISHSISAGNKDDTYSCLDRITRTELKRLGA